ncbi:unnamed protein product [Ascophyllum nodosum]
MRESVLRQTVVYDMTTASGLEDELREVVLLYYVDPVARYVEHAMDDSSQMTALQLRSKGAVVVTLMYALNDLDDVLRFDGRAMREYERRLDHAARKLDEILRHTISLLDSHKHLANQIAQVCREADAVRKWQGRDVCPRVFFVVPADKTKLSRIERATKFNLFTKNMQLYFVCRMFFEDLRKAIPPLSSTRPTDITWEYSVPIDIKQPRDFVKSWGPAARLSLKVVQVLGHAAAIGFGAGQLIPNMSLADHDTLFEILQTNLETLSEEIGADSPIHEGNALHSSSLRSMKLDDDGAHEAMQGYLEGNHKGKWRQNVLDNLEIVQADSVDLGDGACTSTPTNSDGFVYVCRKNLNHRQL